MSPGPVQPNMMGGPMRPGMNMGGMGPGPTQAQTIMSNQMPNGPNTMVRTVGPMGPGVPMSNMIRQPGAMISGQPRMMGTNVRMAIRVSYVLVVFLVSFNRNIYFSLLWEIQILTLQCQLPLVV